MSVQIQASDDVIKAIDQALAKLTRGLWNKVNIAEKDFSGPIVIPVEGILRSTSVYFKALQQGHAKKKAVRQLGKQLERLGSLNDDNGECYRAVLKLIEDEPKKKSQKSIKKPRAIKPEKAAAKLRLVQ